MLTDDRAPWVQMLTISTMIILGLLGWVLGIGDLCAGAMLYDKNVRKGPVQCCEI